jgi:hypothetical protein
VSPFIILAGIGIDLSDGGACGSLQLGIHEGPGHTVSQEEVLDLALGPGGRLEGSGLLEVPGRLDRRLARLGGPGSAGEGRRGGRSRRTALGGREWSHCPDSLTHSGLQLNSFKLAISFLFSTLSA